MIKECKGEAPGFVRGIVNEIEPFIAKAYKQGYADGSNPFIIPGNLTDEEKDIWLAGYVTAMEEMQGLRNAMKDLAENYIYKKPYSYNKDN